MIDFYTTSVLRPNILHKCYESFQKNLIGINLKNCRLFLNIDPVPEPPWPHSAEENIKVASIFFGIVVPRIAEQSCLGWAVKWLWSHIETEFVFLLEDDWCLLESIDINKMLRCFKKKPSLQQVRLLWANKSYMIKKKRDIINYGLSPGISRGEFCKYITYLMKGIRENKRFNAERFMRRPGRYHRYLKHEINTKEFKTPSLAKRKREIFFYPPYQKHPKAVIENMSNWWKPQHKEFNVAGHSLKGKGMRVGSGGRWCN